MFDRLIESRGTDDGVVESPMSIPESNLNNSSNGNGSVFKYIPLPLTVSTGIGYIIGDLITKFITFQRPTYIHLSIMVVIAGIGTGILTAFRFALSERSFVMAEARYQRKVKHDAMNYLHLFYNLSVAGKAYIAGLIDRMEALELQNIHLTTILAKHDIKSVELTDIKTYSGGKLDTNVRRWLEQVEDAEAKLMTWQTDISKEEYYKSANKE